MKVNKWNQIKQGHTSLEGQQMATELEVIFFPCVSNKKMGKKKKKKPSALVKKQVVILPKAPLTASTKNIGLCGALHDRGGSLILM